jgi:hypothetical protein
MGTITNEGYRIVILTISENGNNIIECRYYKAEATDSKAAVIYVGGVGEDRIALLKNCIRGYLKNLLKMMGLIHYALDFVVPQI